MFLEGGYSIAPSSLNGDMLENVKKYLGRPMVHGLKVRGDKYVMGVFAPGFGLVF